MSQNSSRLRRGSGHADCCRLFVVSVVSVAADDTRRLNSGSRANACACTGPCSRACARPRSSTTPGRPGREAVRHNDTEHRRAG
jgi:hypothetical protein